LSPPQGCCLPGDKTGVTQAPQPPACTPAGRVPCTGKRGQEGTATPLRLRGERGRGGRERERETERGREREDREREVGGERREREERHRERGD
jgi:hypothetical protein